MSIIGEIRRGGVPEEAERVAESEGVPLRRILDGLERGRIVIPHNPRHEIEPVGIGEGLRVKINANIGTSVDHVDVEEELEKARVAVEYGADAVMDLSTGGDLDAIRKRILEEVRVPLGTVPIYQVAKERALEDAIVLMTEDDLFNAIEKHARDGVDFMTVHCGVTRESIEKLKRSDRLTGVVSRGGAFLTAWVLHNDRENPLYANYDYLLELAGEYEFTLSLGDGLRPGCIHDATDAPQIEELLILGRLVKRAREAGVQAMVEGPGHVPIHEIAANVRLEKAVCDGAPFYVLGPLVSDIFPGYDHITGAIGGALAALEGADFLCYVTPAEHLALPTVEDVKEGVIASKIAAHAADLARGIGWELDNKMSEARGRLDWDSMFQRAVDRKKAEDYRGERAPGNEEVCSMCGDLCAIRMVREFLKKG
ncbi:MAG: phosphomethylpyrimidine synthase ThiC [Thermoplasmata archaeon]|nr:phosphomethylpyrimidine synthase ThiC [Thermoplasmata archaeon]